MTRDSLPPRFKPWRPPKPKAMERQKNAGRHRISPRKRGYTARWDKISTAFRRANPFCAFCMQERAEEGWELTAVADHILPAHEYPELRYTWSNLLGLCSFHHDVTKQRLESHARKHGLLDELPEWCADPLSRPVHLQPAALTAPK